jgi:hypothetical protein
MLTIVRTEVPPISRRPTVLRNGNVEKILANARTLGKEACKSMSLLCPPVIGLLKYSWLGLDEATDRRSIPTDHTNVLEDLQ